MKFLHYTLGILFAFCLMIILFITSIEAVTYWTPGYYQREYEKYNVLKDVRMEMDDLLDVTEEMMAYLRGSRDDLHVPTIVDGQPREFFNQREIAHMEDVRKLFLGAISIRRYCMVVAAGAIALMCYLKADVLRVLPRTICAGTMLFFGILSVLGGIIATNFSRYFIVFHEIFFDNDLWILNPATDLLINIVPEPFFMDTALYIAIVFGCSVAAVFAGCLIWMRKQKKS